MNFAKNIKFVVPILFTFFIIAFFWYTKISAVKLYPPLMNFVIFTLFFSSLFAKETVIQKFAKLMDGKLEEPITTYTRRLTYVWVVFLFVNFLVSLLTLFLSDKIWMLYNGCVSYLIVGLIFILEYIFRFYFKKRHNL